MKRFIQRLIILAVGFALLAVPSFAGVAKASVKTVKYANSFSALKAEKALIFPARHPKRTGKFARKAFVKALK